MLEWFWTIFSLGAPEVAFAVNFSVVQEMEGGTFLKEWVIL